MNGEQLPGMGSVGDGDGDCLGSEPFAPEIALSDEEQATTRRQRYIRDVRDVVLPVLEPLIGRDDARPAGEALARLHFPARAAPAALPEPAALADAARRLYFIASQHEARWDALADAAYDGTPGDDQLIGAIGDELSPRLPHADGRRAEALPKALAGAIRRTVEEPGALLPYVRDDIARADRPLKLRHGLCVYAWRAFLAQYLLDRDALARLGVRRSDRFKIESRAAAVIILAELVDLREGMQALAAIAVAIAPPEPWALPPPPVPLIDPSEAGFKAGGPERTPIRGSEAPAGEETTEEAAQREAEADARAADYKAYLAELAAMANAADWEIFHAVDDARRAMHRDDQRFARILDCLFGSPEGDAARLLALDPPEYRDKLEPTISRARAARRRLLAGRGIIRAEDLDGDGERLGARHVLPSAARPLCGVPGEACEMLLEMEAQLRGLFEAEARDRTAAFWDQVGGLLVELHRARAQLRAAAHARDVDVVFEHGVVGKPFRKMPDGLWRGDRVPPEPLPHAAEGGRVIACPPPPRMWRLDPARTMRTVATAPADDADRLRQMLYEDGPGQWMYFVDGEELDV